MVTGIKSKFFGCYWQSMFITGMTLYEKFDKKNKEHVKKRRDFQRFYASFKNVISCKYCREYTKTVLEKKYPLDFSGRIALMKSLYIWKDQINKKLIAQGCDFTQPSPPFKEILAKYDLLRASCNKKVGKCI